MKLIELVNCEKSLDQLVSMKFSAILSFKIASFYNKVKPELINYETVRVAKVKQYGEVQADGGILVTPENFNTFSKEIEEVQNTEIDIAIPEIYVEDLQSLDAIEPSFFTNLGWLIKEREPKLELIK